ncbi:MAG: hypothetical protein PHO16_08930 [Candidatus Cloacimonetes bacterium]|nr:hypothetical protein [Candidatus Cloacimonadota bacterium]
MVECKFVKTPKAALPVIQEQELFERTYVLRKDIDAKQDVIRYVIYRDSDEVLSCTLRITHQIKDSDKSYLNDYTDLDKSIAKSMFRHLKRNILVKQNTLQLRRIKLENQIAKEKARKGKKV